MSLITANQRRRLILNGIAAERDPQIDPFPVVKLAAQWNGTVWLLTEMAPNDPDRLFGLKIIHGGSPDLDYFRISGFESLSGPHGERVASDEGRPTSKRPSIATIHLSYKRYWPPGNPAALCMGKPDIRIAGDVAAVWRRLRWMPVDRQSEPHR